MPRSKKEKIVLHDISERVLKYWYIDTIAKKIKHVDDYDGKSKLVGYDSDVGRVVDEDGKFLKIYTTFREASIVLYAFQVEELRVQWQFHVDESLRLNNEISDILDKRDKLKSSGD